MTEFPRTLLLTWWPPSLKYAGGEFVRRLIGVLPSGQVKWACLSPIARDRTYTECECKSFVPFEFNWRLKKYRLTRAVSIELTAHAAAKQISEWIQPWQPQVLWVLPELAAVGVATRLKPILGIPLHLTLHDAFESAGYSQLPGCYVRRFARQASDLVKSAVSLDGISKELIEHTIAKSGCGSRFPPSNYISCSDEVRQRQLPTLSLAAENHFNKLGSGSVFKNQELKTMVFPPSISKAVIASGVKQGENRDVFRLAVCGSMRTEREQWVQFIQELTSVFKNVELVAIGDALEQAEMVRSINVSIECHDYFAKEDELIAFLQARRVDAGYAGIWTSEAHRLFAQTSFSSKITVFAAAGIPTIFDGPGDSAAWQLLGQWNAGILWKGAPETSTTLKNLKDPVQWKAMADGALAMCRDDLCLEHNAVKFQQILSTTQREL